MGPQVGAEVMYVNEAGEAVKARVVGRWPRSYMRDLQVGDEVIHGVHLDAQKRAQTYHETE